MKKRYILLALAVIIQIILPGCWDYMEYEQMAHVIAVGVDFSVDTGNFTTSIQHIPSIKSGNTGTGSSKSSPNQVGSVHTATDKTFYGCLAKLQQVVALKMFYGYQKVMVIGKEAAENKLSDILELHDRSPMPRNTAYLVFVSGKAQNTLATLDADSSISSGQEIFNLINLSPLSNSSYPITVQDFLEMLSIGGLEATAPYITTTAKDNEAPEAKGGKEGPYELDIQREGDQIITATAVFKSDRFIGLLNNKENLGYGWITGKAIKPYKTSMVSGSTENVLYYHIGKSKSKIKVKLIEGKPVIHVSVNTVGNLTKYYGGKGSEFLSPEQINDAEKKLSESIRSDIEAALAKAQKEYKSDIFGFGFALFRKSPKLWRNVYEKKWEDTFPDILVNIKVKTKIINTGSNIRKLDIK
ncbi:MAG TPA: Ger(x)C family spore germination protein [Clostridia bacterium]|nr:Ger(x)C family spore germination protein [Clostridia bacterium]